ncbi:MAG: DUF4321 domain-containing protein [Fibrobacteres bacterium]|jgi:hypothetical protein|nr:DUF4321 domain-containing protein [Fibrobacterota bacterium]
MNRNAGVGRLVVFILLGLVLGGILGEVLGVVLGQIGVLSGGDMNNPIRNFFVKAFELDLGYRDGWAIDLYTVKLRLGLGLKFNACSILGVALSLYFMKWSNRG